MGTYKMQDRMIHCINPIFNELNNFSFKQAHCDALCRLYCPFNKNDKKKIFSPCTPYHQETCEILKEHKNEPFQEIVIEPF